MRDILDDFVAERDELRSILSQITPDDFDTVTPAEPWTIRDQVSHLAFYDDAAAFAVFDPEEFADEVARAASLGMSAYMEESLEQGRSMTPEELIEWLSGAEASLVSGLQESDPESRIPWYGPPMRARSFVIARLMETWAHGQDIVDALGIDRSPSNRLFHIAELGIRAFRFSYENRGMPVPEERVRVAVRGATGTVRVWNDDQSNSVTGPLEEFCLVVTQRRHIDDTHLVVEGPIAAEWMSIAQTFAGPPGPGRPSSI